MKMLNKPEEIRAITLFIISYLGNELDAGNLQSAVLSTGLMDMTDYYDCIESLNRDNLIFLMKTGGKDVCGITKKGKSILPELTSFIPDGIREEAVRCAWHYYESLVNGIDYFTRIEKDGEDYYVVMGVKIHGRKTVETRTYFKTEKEAVEAKTNCETRPQAVINTILAAVTGDVNFIM